MHHLRPNAAFIFSLLAATCLLSAQAPAQQSADVDYLPPADLGTQPTMPRGKENVPMTPEALTSAPLKLTIPDVNQTTLTNGIRFYHYESHDLPRVRVTLLVEAGETMDPADKVGLAQLTARAVRSGGAGKKSGDEIDLELEQIGSDLTISADRDHVMGSMFALADKTTQALELLSEVIKNPQFDPKKVEQQRALMVEQIRRQNDEPQDISRREFRKIIYGPDHPLARTPTTASLAGITVDDIRKFHQDHYRPSTLWIGLSGDISQEQARAAVEQTFGKWDRPAAAEVAAIPTPTETDATTLSIYLTPKATAQSQIRLGHLGIERKSPDAYAINVLNSIYGTGGFSSRLMNQVRTKHGYVYGVGGGVTSDEPVGLFAAAAASKAATTGAAIKEILSVTDSIINGPISQAELDTAKRDVFFTFANQFDTPQDIISTHMIYDYRGYAPDYLKNFPQQILDVSMDDLKRVATKYLHPDKLRIYIIGNPEQMDIAPSDLGATKEWPVENQ